MYKKIAVTIPDYIFNEYLKEVKNKSEYICKMIYVGYGVMTCEGSSLKSQLLKVIQDNTNLQTEIKTLKANIQSLNSKIKPADIEILSPIDKYRADMEKKKRDYDRQRDKELDKEHDNK